VATPVAALEPMPDGDRQIGPYRLLGSLGRGGMAEVFKAEHVHLGQARALKILLPEISARPEIVGRLLTEARALGRMRHPSIVEVFDCDVLSDGTAFIAMEYVRGEAMRAWLERVGKLTSEPTLAAAIVGAVGEGLAFAHRQGVVHRDLKPENILLVGNPSDPDAFSIKILDFGVAKLLREEPLTTTRHGCVIGTPIYMAPEQWRPGSAIDHRADIYALGCLFFELLCGRPPFVEYDDVSMMRAHLDDPPPPVTSLEEGLPAGWCDLISRMLAKAPADRPQSVEEVLTALESLLGYERSRWSQLLRTPSGWSVGARETGPGVQSSGRLASVRSPARPGVPGLPSRWGRTVGDPRTRVALIACLGVVSAAALAGAVLLRDKNQSKPSPVATRAGPGIVATPLPPATQVRSFRVHLASQPADAEVWVEGERTARGRTPIDLIFFSVVPKMVELRAPGFRKETLTISPAHAQSTEVPTIRLLPESKAEPLARKRRDPRPPPRTANIYRPVGD
jgi:serine/threonine protein kinase